MNGSFIFLWMIFMHFLDDFVLQRISRLGELKQLKWWIENASDKKYQYDYLVALFAHCFSWVFMMMLPVAFLYNFNIPTIFVVLFFANLYIHLWVDNLKANQLKINLWVDQSIHILQIIITFFILVF